MEVRHILEDVNILVIIFIKNETNETGNISQPPKYIQTHAVDKHKVPIPTNNTGSRYYRDANIDTIFCIPNIYITKNQEIGQFLNRHDTSK